MPKIKFITTERRYEIAARAGEYLFEVLARCNIPRNSVLLLDEYQKFCSVARQLTEEDIVWAYAIRNIDYSTVYPQYTVRPCDGTPATETVVNSYEGPGRQVLLLSRDEALTFVYNSVKKVIDEYVQDKEGVQALQVGLSPGGDGRVLAECLRRYIDDGGQAQFNCIIVGAGFEDEHEHVSNAIELAERYNLTYSVFGSEEAGRLLGYRAGLDDLAGDYRVEHPSDAAEMLPTYLLQQLHFAVARSEGRRAIIMGYNFEDVLAERLYHLMTGQLLPAFPVRQLKDFDIIAPLCDIDKHLLDSLDVQNSLRNYRARRVSGGDLRSTLYMMAYSLADSFPAVARGLAHGTRWSSQPEELDNWLRLRSVDLQ